MDGRTTNDSYHNQQGDNNEDDDDDDTPKVSISKRTTTGEGNVDTPDNGQWTMDKHKHPLKHTQPSSVQRNKVTHSHFIIISTIDDK